MHISLKEILAMLFTKKIILLNMSLFFILFDQYPSELKSFSVIFSLLYIFYIQRENFGDRNWKKLKSCGRHYEKSFVDTALKLQVKFFSITKCVTIRVPFLTKTNAFVLCPIYT